MVSLKKKLKYVRTKLHIAVLPIPIVVASYSYSLSNNSSPSNAKTSSNGLTSKSPISVSYLNHLIKTENSACGSKRIITCSPFGNSPPSRWAGLRYQGYHSTESTHSTGFLVYMRALSLEQKIQPLFIVRYSN